MPTQIPYPRAVLALIGSTLAASAVISCKAKEWHAVFETPPAVVEGQPADSLALENPVPKRPPRDYRLLELSSEWGRALFRECELTLLLPQYEGPASSHLMCILNTLEAERLEAHHEFTSEETDDLWLMVEAADLFGPGHIGADSRQMDGGLTILVVTKPRATTAIVVSHNPTFETPGPRKELATWLADHQCALWNAWLETRPTHSPAR